MHQAMPIVPQEEAQVKNCFSTTNANHGVTGLLVLIRGIF